MSVSSITLPSGYQAGQFTPAFDPTETNGANVIPSELQVVVANFGTDVQFLVPSYAPFFADSFNVVYTDPLVGDPQTLVAGVDFFFAFPFISATRSCNKPVYGGIVIANNRLAGNFVMQYHTLGGVWSSSVSIDQAIELLIGVDPYVTAWEQVINYAGPFPIITTPWDKTDPTDIPAVVEQVLALRDAVVAAAGTSQTANQQAIDHVFDIDNPHEDQASQIGLENVANLPPATNAQAADASNTTTYIAAAQLALAFQAGVPPANDSTPGMLELNAGTQAGDATDPVKALTSAGFLLLAGDSGNPLGAAFNKQQQEARFTPYPFSFPCIWSGNTYNSMPALQAAIQNSVGVFPLEFSVNQGKIWFPSGITPPDLTITH
jgi:hypothetical protein